MNFQRTTGYSRDPIGGYVVCVLNIYIGPPQRPLRSGSPTSSTASWNTPGVSRHEVEVEGAEERAGAWTVVFVARERERGRGPGEGTLVKLVNDFRDRCHTNGWGFVREMDPQIHYTKDTYLL